MLGRSVTVSGEGHFWSEIPCLRGVQWRIVCLQCHPSGCNFWLEWFVWINGTAGTCQTSRFGDWGHDKCAMGPKQSLEGVLFGLKSPCLRGAPWHVLGLQSHPCGCNCWSEWFVWISGTGGTCQTYRFGYGAHARCSRGPKRLLERGLFQPKIPISEGDSAARSWPPMSLKWM